MRKPSERNPRIRFPLNSVRAEVPCTLSVVVNLTTIEPAAQEPCLQSQANQTEMSVYFCKSVFLQATVGLVGVSDDGFEDVVFNHHRSKTIPIPL